MNIFATDPDPYQSAVWLDDKRVIKMILETAQLLSSAIILNGGVSRYRLTHQNHPCAIWARETIENFKWLYEHGLSLASVYALVYGKEHACVSIMQDCYNQRDLIPKGELTPFANATTYKNPILDVHTAYRLYMCDKWDADPSPTWKNRDIPEWRLASKDVQ